MKDLERIVAVLLCLATVGCAGLTIETISKTPEGDARDGHPRVGYVVYEPVIVYQKTPVRHCGGYDASGNCAKPADEDVCQFIGPILLPDKTRPYSLKPHVGLGKADINIQIKDGWMLAELSEKSDNTAILDRIAAPKTSSAPTAPSILQKKPSDIAIPPRCEGLWQWDGQCKQFVQIFACGANAECKTKADEKKCGP